MCVWMGYFFEKWLVYNIDFYVKPFMCAYTFIAHMHFHFFPNACSKKTSGWRFHSFSFLFSPLLSPLTVVLFRILHTTHWILSLTSHSIIIRSIFTFSTFVFHCMPFVIERIFVCAIILCAIFDFGDFENTRSQPKQQQKWEAKWCEQQQLYTHPI